ncbi:MAG: tRNA CCA-pyrophosphorylase [Deltaproteobacteria bacterium]|nr:MAG: tRNA CCA-pyrophosphorylase [Deltaproteobacteria bacterium]
MAPDRGIEGQTSICGRTYEEYLDMIMSFHGHVAPGVVLGGFMVELAWRHRPEGEFFDALCETRACLPDAVQILTPCTIGNGWLRVINVGRFALSLYEKYSGRGARVFVDAVKMDPFPELKAWFFRLKPKKDQSFDVLMEEIRRAGVSVCGVEHVNLDPAFVTSHRRKGFIVCPSCGEAFPLEEGPVCGGCRGELPYLPRTGSRR